MRTKTKECEFNDAQWQLCSYPNINSYVVEKIVGHEFAKNVRSLLRNTVINRYIETFANCVTGQTSASGQVEGIR